MYDLARRIQIEEARTHAKCLALRRTFNQRLRALRGGGGIEITARSFDHSEIIQITVPDNATINICNICIWR